MRCFFLPDQNITLEPAREVLPGLWVGKQSGRALEQLRKDFPSILLIDQANLGSSRHSRHQRRQSEPGDWRSR